MAPHRTAGPPPAAGPGIVPGVGQVIGHRGAAGHAPENTLAAIEKAAALGVRWVEVDTKLTADGAVVLFHDDALERTTDGRGPVARTALADLRRLDAGSWFGDAFRGERVPTLTEAIDAFARLGLGAVIEIKPCPGRAAETGTAVAALLGERWPDALPPPMVASFDGRALMAARTRAPGLARALNVFHLPRDWWRARELGCAAVHCRARGLTLRRVAAAARAGFEVRAFTVNAPKRARTLFGMGVAGVFSDFPDRIASHVYPRGGQGRTPGQ